MLLHFLTNFLEHQHILLHISLNHIGRINLIQKSSERVNVARITRKDFLYPYICIHTVKYQRFIGHASLYAVYIA